MMISPGEASRVLRSYLQRSASTDGVQSNARSAVSGDTKGRDKIDFSSRAQDLQKLKFILSHIPDVRVDLVGELRRAIENGEYAVDSKAVAEQMILRMIGDRFAV